MEKQIILTIDFKINLHGNGCSSQSDITCKSIIFYIHMYLVHWKDQCGLISFFLNPFIFVQVNNSGHFISRKKNLHLTKWRNWRNPKLKARQNLQQATTMRSEIIFSRWLKMNSLNLDRLWRRGKKHPW